MEDKDKKANDEKKNEVENKEKEKSDLEEEVIERIVNELEEKYNLKKENIKIVKVGNQGFKPSIFKIVLKELLFWLFDFLLIIALHGYFRFPESNPLNLLLFSIVFYIIEMSGRTIINRYFKKLLLYSFGTVMLPITVVALILAQLATNIELSDNILLFVIVFIGVRIIIRYIIMRKEIQSVMRGRKKWVR